ncbi:GNAT family N-acetyltransferase [Algicella marina]|uniref:GNAT family N-acetyltransferase n=1 Tax=Algicella marina TaxID=2683284 RepID=A0A6P1T229_9RHOB|nr:GNAT family N-acetyltransferase [Algicella marina]QHQ36984.1 GNAT family N-acetyltransferase [Algicella marina]
MITLRPAWPEEAGRLAEIAEAAFGGYIAAIGKPPAPMYPDFPALIAKGRVWVNEDLSAYSVHYRDGDALHLEAVVVAPDAQGRGLGRKVIAWVEAEARRLGLPRVELYTNAAMAGPLRLYPALGYAEVSRHEEAGFARVFFEKDVRGLEVHPVRRALLMQATICRRLKSPFTAAVIDCITAALREGTVLGDRVLHWPGDPAPRGDALALRLAGALHVCVRAGRLPRLAEFYPPAAMSAFADLQDAVTEACRAEGQMLADWLTFAPQTNETGRSAALYPGLMAIADRFGLPMDLLELGASAGLNTNLARYGYTLGGTDFGDRKSAVQIVPEWRGPAPTGPEPCIGSACGVDLNPLDTANPEVARRLMAYAWPDQPERLARLEAAIAIARAHPPRLVAGDAADWLEAELAATALPGRVRVVCHTIAFQYFPPDSQARIRAALAAAGARAGAEAPLAWLTLEFEDTVNPVLCLQTWPGGGRETLATAHPHGTWIEWRGEEATA